MYRQISINVCIDAICIEQLIKLFVAMYAVMPI